MYSVFTSKSRKLLFCYKTLKNVLISLFIFIKHTQRTHNIHFLSLSFRKKILKTKVNIFITFFFLPVP